MMKQLYSLSNVHLEQTAQLRKKLLANISHDLGTPVTVIHNYLQSVEQGIIEDEEKEQYLQLASIKVRMLDRLISETQSYLTK